MSNDSTRASVLSDSTIHDDSISAEIAAKADAQLIVVTFVLPRCP